MPSLKHHFFNARYPVIFGHRGSAGTRPENTLVAFDECVRQLKKIDKSSTDHLAIETDVHLTKDGHVVIFHDDTLERTTNGTGKIKDKTLAELKQLDAGYHFSHDAGQTFPYRGKGITIPTLEEAFKRYPNIKINIDLKAKSKTLIGKVLGLIKRYKREDRTVLASFHDDVIQQLREAQTHTGIHTLTCGAEKEVTHAILKNKFNMFRYPKETPIVFEVPTNEKVFGLGDFAVTTEVMTQKFVNTLHHLGHYVVPWVDKNEPQEIARLLAMGVDGIITDYPEMAVNVAKRFQKPSAR